MSKVHSIEELKQKCAEKNMPLEKMRFFIGVDMKEPKCFGVYRDEETGDWIVYKNKANGERAIRYSGPDEARAAQEIWNKIGDEVKLRKDKYASPYDDSVMRELSTETKTEPPKEELGGILGAVATVLGFFIYLFSNKAFAVFVILVILYFVLGTSSPDPRQGYYQIGDSVYYYLADSWYMYDSGDWTSTYVDDGDIEDYYIGEDYSADLGTTDFEETSIYEKFLEEKKNENDDYDDDDYDYDYDDWDAGDTDWDTDW